MVTPASAMPQNLFRNAAKQNPRNSRSSMSSDDDHVALRFFRHPQNLAGRFTLNDPILDLDPGILGVEFLQPFLDFIRGSAGFKLAKLARCVSHYRRLHDMGNQ